MAIVLISLKKIFPKHVLIIESLCLRPLCDCISGDVFCVWVFPSIRIFSQHFSASASDDAPMGGGMPPMPVPSPANKPDVNVPAREGEEQTEKKAPFWSKRPYCKQYFLHISIFLVSFC